MKRQATRISTYLNIDPINPRGMILDFHEILERELGAFIAEER